MVNVLSKRIQSDV